MQHKMQREVTHIEGGHATRGVVEEQRQVLHYLRQCALDEAPVVNPVIIRMFNNVTRKLKRTSRNKNGLRTYLYVEACFTAAPVLCRISDSRYRPAIFTAA
jgi:hypothetical protein